MSLFGGLSETSSTMLSHGTPVSDTPQIVFGAYIYEKPAGVVAYGADIYRHPIKFLGIHFQISGFVGAFLFF